MNESVVWEWDPGKDEANDRKHGIDFSSALLVFDDAFAVTIEDTYPHEFRLKTTGLVGWQIWVVIHTEPTAGVIPGALAGRIISARKATARERRAYEQGKV